MKNKLKIFWVVIASILYVSGLVFFASIAYGYYKLGNECLYYTYYFSGYKLFCDHCFILIEHFITLFVKLSPFFGISLIGYLYGKAIKLDSAYSSIFYIIIPIILFSVQKKLFERNFNKYFESKECIVTSVTIEDKSKTRSAGFIKYTYALGKIGIFSNQSIDQNDYRKIKVNDTILVKYIVGCETISKPFKLFPTKEELEKCKNDCYLIDGKLIEKK